MRKTIISFALLTAPILACGAAPDESASSTSQAASAGTGLGNGIIWVFHDSCPVGTDYVGPGYDVNVSSYDYLPHDFRDPGELIIIPDGRPGTHAMWYYKGRIKYWYYADPGSQGEAMLRSSGGAAVDAGTAPVCIDTIVGNGADHEPPPPPPNRRCYGPDCFPTCLPDSDPIFSETDAAYETYCFTFVPSLPIHRVPSGTLPQ
jgi:hypothetical protein